MTLQWGATDPFNTLRRPRPIGFDMNTGVGTADERVWFGALYLQDQWTLKQFTISGAVRYDHAQSRYGETCIGPDRFVPIQADGKNFWCSTPADGVSYNDITPRWGRCVGRVRHRQDFHQVEHGQVPAGRRFRWQLHRQQFGAPIDEPADARTWDDVNGNRIVECDFFNPAPHTSSLR